VTSTAAPASHGATRSPPAGTEPAGR
jgi:hypothetical protein